MSEDKIEPFLVPAQIVSLALIFIFIFMPFYATKFFNFSSYLDPLKTQYWIASAISTSSMMEETFTSSRIINTPMKINIYKQDPYVYVDVTPIEKEFLEGKSIVIEPSEVITDCQVQSKTYILEQALHNEITIIKSQNIDGTCKIELLV